MPEFQDLKKAFTQIFSRPVAFHPILARLSGSATTGLFLSQACYWTEYTDQERDGWFYKTQEDWFLETCLTRREQETARKQLRAKGYLEEQRRGVPARLWYRVNFERIWGSLTQSSLYEAANPDWRFPPNKNGVFRQSLLLTESTTESTTENICVKPVGFTPPTQAEVAFYMKQRRIPDPEKQAELFIAHHANREWRLSGGRGPKMKSWQQAVITWQGNMGKFSPPTQKQEPDLEEELRRLTNGQRSKPIAR